MARLFQKEIEKLGHEVSWDVDALLIGSGWRDALMRSLSESDAVIVLLTPESMKSPMVISEVGAARAFATTEKKIALLPVLIGLGGIPSFIQDLFVLQAKTGDAAEVKCIAEEIHRSIEAHLNAIAQPSGPRIFISHRHKDNEIARALTEVLSTAFKLEQRDIRCTSVQPYRLPFGKNTGERLRDEIRGAEVVLGLLAPDTAESSYVMFELGAAWGDRLYTCPLLIGSASFEHIPGPIYDLAPAKLWVDSDCYQLIDDLANELSVLRRDGTQGQLAEKIQILVKAAAGKQ
jgi:hypothetical protein